MKRSIMLGILVSVMVSFVFAGGQQPGAGGTGGGGRTLKLAGPSQFNVSGQDGSIDAITGRELPGYQMMLDEWKKVYPDVSVVIETTPWDNWQAAIQTAVLAGGVDVIIHGATMTDLSMALNDYVAADPAWASKRLGYAIRRSDTLGPLTTPYITGIPVTIAPMIVYINKEILAHYNINLPDDTWTWDDFLAIAKACTGRDPVTGQQTYGLQFHNSHSNNEMWKDFYIIAYGIDAAPTIQYGTTAKNSRLNYTDANAQKIWNYIGELAKYTSPKDREGLDISKPTVDMNIAIYFSESPVASHDDLKVTGNLDKYYVQSLPRINAGTLKGDVSPYIGDSNLSIFRESKQKDLAWEWIKFCTTNEAALKYYTDNGGIVNHKDYYPNLNQLISQSWVDAVGRAIAKIPENFSTATGLYTNNVSFGNLNATIGGGIRMLMMGTGTPTDAGASVQKVVDDYISSIR